MRNYLFKFLDFRVTSVHFQINESWKSSRKPVKVSPALKIGFQEAKEKNGVKVVLEVDLDGTDKPFTFAVQVAGIFEFQEKVPRKDLIRIAEVNCAAILFPYLRETIADLTRRSGFPPLHLGPVNFMALYDAKEGKKKKDTKKP
jgi:preprotein translocase subunit SecB